jgi:hypothetical protein
VVWIYSSQASKPVSSLSATNTENHSNYAGPNVNYAVIGNLNANSRITLTGKNGDTWVTFSFNGQQGWIQDFFLDVDGNTSRLPQVAYVPVPTSTKRPQVAPAEPSSACAIMSARAGEFVNCKIEHAYCSYQPATSGSPTFCNDAPYPNNNFTLLVWGEDWSDYDGKCIIISGLMSLYQGKPQIEAVGRSQISLCP